MSLYDYNLSLSHLGIFFSFVFRISSRLVPVKTNIYRFLRVTYTLISYMPLSLMFPTHLLATGFPSDSSKDNDIPISNVSKYLDEPMNHTMKKNEPPCEIERNRNEVGNVRGRDETDR